MSASSGAIAPAGARRWLRRNLFGSALDAAASLAILAGVAASGGSLLYWALVAAEWHVVGDSLRVLMLGTFPVGQDWRVWCALCAMGLAACAVLVPRLRRHALALLAVAGATSFAVLGPAGLDAWGGLMLSLMLTLFVSAATLPLGILLAFGRRSRSPSIRFCCTAFIEVMRSVPLILVVYWVWISVPLLAPQLSASALARGMAGYTMFYCAYVAEYVRSGLQAVPKGQVEAALSLGMSPWSVATEIVLPQAIKVVLPALVGNVLDVFNGATLVFIIGLTDFLRAGQMILADPTSSSRTNEVYVFMFAVYFAIGSAITFGARRIEARLHGSSRR